MKRLMRIFLWVVVAVLGMIAMANLWIIGATQSEIYNDSKNLATHEVGLVLGTSNKKATGEENPFFRGRIDAAVELYKTGKIKYIIVSGDNATKYYNEPLKMQQALMADGVPENVITLDYAGFRTLDSIVRCKEIFGQSDIIIISQGFHCNRALFISNYYDMNAKAFATEKLPLNVSFRVIAREFLARPFAIWDTYFIGTEPKHLGEKEELRRG